MIYLFILLLLVYLTWHYDVKDNIKWREYAFWGVFVLFLLLAGLRYKIGTDTNMYMRVWNTYPNFWDFSWDDDIERFRMTSTKVERFRPGWIFLCMLIRAFTDEFTVLQMVVSILFNTALFLAIKKYSKSPFLTLLLFYFSFKFLEFEFEIMRETVAVAIFMLLAFNCYIKKKWLPYYLWTLLCYFMHSSAVLMFVLPVIRNVEWSLLKYSLIMVLPGFLMGIAGRLIFGDLVNIFFGGDDFISSYAADAFAEETNANYLIMFSLQPTLLYLLAAFGFKRFKNKALIPLVFFSISFMYMSMLYFTAGRLVNYIIIYVYIAVTPLVMHLVRKFKTVWIAVLLMLVYFAPTLWSFTKPSNIARYYPYQWVINPNQTKLQKTL